MFVGVISRVKISSAELLVPVPQFDISWTATGRFEFLQMYNNLSK